jgi:hypothetical protein
MITLRHLIITLAFALSVTAAGQVSATRVSENQSANEQYMPTAEEMVLDGLIYRPISLAGTVIGTGIFIVTLPFSILGGNVEDAGQKLVIEPARITFGSCLGCIRDYSVSASGR